MQNNSSQNKGEITPDLTLLLNSSASALVLVDHLGIIQYCNEAIEVIFGYYVSDLLGGHISRLLLPTTRQKHQHHLDDFFDKPFNRSMGNGASFPAFHRSGKTIYVSIGLCSYEQDGQQFVLATITPAARLNEATNSLLESQEDLNRRINENKRLLQVANNSNDAVFLLNQEQHVTWMNNAAGKLLESQLDLLLGINILDCINREKQPKLIEKLREALVLGQTFTGEIEMSHHQGHFVQVDAALQPVFERDKLQGFYLTARDITDRRRLEAQMRENNELLETTARIAKLGFYSLDLVHNTLTWSEEVYNIHELPKNQRVLVDDALQYYAPEARPIISQAVQRCVASGEAFDLELPFITAKKRRIWVRSVGYAEFRDGSPVKLKGAFQDITNLRQAATDAEQAALAKSNFLANMSHELRTPITGVMGVSELLGDTMLEPQQQKYLNIINHSAASLLFLVNQVLDYAKLDSGLQKLHPSHFNLHQFMQEKSTIHQLAAEDKGYVFVLDIDENVPQILFADKDRLAQIINNLCANAIKFTSHGSVTLALKMMNGLLRVEIIDTGIGIQQDDIKKLFHKFQQIDSTFSRAHQGTGLGLTISKQLIELMGGNIGLESVYEKGSTFWFTLPVDESECNTVVALAKPLPHTLVLVSDEIHVSAWLQVARQKHVTIHACTRLSEIISSLKESAQWKIVLVMDTDDSLPVDTQLSTIERFLNMPQQLVLSTQVAASLANASAADSSKQIAPAVMEFKPAEEIPNLQALINWQFDKLAEWHSNKRVAMETDLSHKHILLVEDNSVNQMLFEEMLAHTNAIITIANNGKEGVEALELQPNHYDLVIMDCQMPIMDGFEATKLIRSHQNMAISNVRIAAATAHAFDGDIQKCYQTGMNDVLVKPFSRQQLLDMIFRNIEKANNP